MQTKVTVTTEDDPNYIVIFDNEGNVIQTVDYNEANFDQYYGGEYPVAVVYQEHEGEDYEPQWRILDDNWFGDGGKFELTVTHYPLEVALEMFSAGLVVATKKDIEVNQ